MQYYDVLWVLWVLWSIIVVLSDRVRSIIRVGDPSALSRRGSTERTEAREPSVMHVHVQQNGNQSNNNSRGECFRFGRGHNPDTCWAKDVEGRKCGAKGHLKSRCVPRGKKVPFRNGSWKQMIRIQELFQSIIFQWEDHGTHYLQKYIDNLQILIHI